MDQALKDKILIQLGREQERKRIIKYLWNAKTSDGKTPSIAFGRRDLIEWIEKTGKEEDQKLGLNPNA